MTKKVHAFPLCEEESISEIYRENYKKLYDEQPLLHSKSINPAV